MDLEQDPGHQVPPLTSGKDQIRDTPYSNSKKKKREQFLKTGISECLPKTKTKSHDVP